MISIKRDTDEIRDPIIKEYEADLLHRKSQVRFLSATSLLEALQVESV